MCMCGGLQLFPTTLLFISINIFLTSSILYNTIFFPFLVSVYVSMQLMSQFPMRPVVLIGFSMASRIAAKVLHVKLMDFKRLLDRSFASFLLASLALVANGFFMLTPLYNCPLPPYLSG